MKAFQPHYKVRSSSVALILLASIFSIIAIGIPVLKAHAYTIPNSITGNIANGNPDTQLLNVANAGDVIVVIIQLHANSGNGTVFPQYTVSDTVGNPFNHVKIHSGTFQGLLGHCGNACATGEIFFGVAPSNVADHITVSPQFGGDPSINGAWEALDVVGIVPEFLSDTTGLTYTGPTTTILSPGSASVPTTSILSVATFVTSCTNGHVVTPVAGMTWLQNGGSLWGGVEYGTPPSSPMPTNFQVTCAIAVTNWFAFGVTIGTIFTCSITNLDGPNYFIANINKFYLFKCELQSNAISVTPSMITDVQIIFNDSLNIYRFEYNNLTGLASVDSGGTIADMGTPIVSNGFNPSNQLRTMNITFPVKLGPNANQAINRGIVLVGSTAINGLVQTVRANYFTILSSGQGGGGIRSPIALSGLCSGLSGGDLFQTICAYGGTAHNWIAQNSTYYQLQQYQAQFSIQLDNHTNGLQLPAFWQDFGHSGAGTNPSSNSKDWQIRAGMYHWDNTTANVCCWVKGVNVRLYMAKGAVGSANLWTGITAEWYYGKNLISNQTFFNFVPSSGNGNSQVNIWLNFWYSQNNGSTTQGGEVGAYFTGMRQVGALIWTSWSPIFANQTQLQTFVPLVNHSGNIIKAQQAQLSMVFMNMSRPGAPNVHAKQPNFDILTTNFQEQEFNVASEGMTGIVTPTFAVAVIPIVQSNSIFSPIINAIKSIGTFFGKTLLALGTVIWNGLAQRFPWFTNAVSIYAGFIVSAIQLLAFVFVYAIDAIKFIYSIVGLVVYPITTIINGYNTITGIYLPIFKGANLQAMLILAVLWIFSGYVIDNAERGDTKGFIALATGAWRVVYTIFNITWMIAKFLVDTVEGIFP